MDLLRVDHDDRWSGWRVLTVHGELDLGTMKVLEGALITAREQSRPVVIDLTPCGFIDSCGIRALVNGSLAHRDAGLTFQVVCPKSNPQVARVLELVGIDEIVVVRDSMREPCPTGE